MASPGERSTVAQHWGWVPNLRRVWYILWVPQTPDTWTLTSVGGGERRGASRGRIWALATIWQIASACNSTELDPLVREAVVISAFRFPHWLCLSPSPSLLSSPGLHAQSLPRPGFWGGKCIFLYDSDSEQFTFYSLRLQESPHCPVPTSMMKHLHFLQGPGKQGVRAEAMASGGS